MTSRSAAVDVKRSTAAPRKAIVDATSRLSADGATPSIDEIAVAADVSRRTIYMYFPTLDHLLIEATLGAFNEPPVEEALADSRRVPGGGKTGRAGSRIPSA